MSDTPRKTIRLDVTNVKDKKPSNDRIRTGARAHRVAKLTHQQKDRVEAATASVPEKNERVRTQRPEPLKTRSSPPRASVTRDTQTAPVISGKPVSKDEKFDIFASCPQGLEAVLTEELIRLKFERVKSGRSGVHFISNWEGVMRANLHSRIATRILVQVAHAPVFSEDELYELAKSTPWERWFGAEQRLRVDTSAIRSPMKSLQFCNLRVKDGICDRLRQREGARPDIDTVRPDARVHAFLSETSATLYLDTSGESLFKRGWRYDKGAAPLRENLAAGMLAIAQWDGQSPLLDPFCGSGTILIEAALKSFQVPPGMTRPFSFERLRHHDRTCWNDLLDEAQANILPKLPALIAGCDLDIYALEAAKSNAKRAGLNPDEIRFERTDARKMMPIAEAGLILTNPPYGERLEQDEDEYAELWTQWASHLKQHFGGWHVGMITSDLSLPKKLRLNPQRKTPLYNGALECRLFEFDMVTGSFR